MKVTEKNKGASIGIKKAYCHKKCASNSVPKDKTPSLNLKMGLGRDICPVEKVMLNHY